MKKLILAAAAATLMSGSAFAATVAGSETCGELPNAKWSWVVTTVPASTTYGDKTYTGDIAYSGNSGNGSSAYSIEVTTTPAYTICEAYNPAGVLNTDKSFGSVPEPVITYETGSEQVCFQSPNTPDLISGCR